MPTKNPGTAKFSSRRKVEAVLRLLRGEELELVSRDLGVTAAKLAEWRDAFLHGGQAALKSRAADSRDKEIEQLKISSKPRLEELAYSLRRRYSSTRLIVSRRDRTASVLLFFSVKEKRDVESADRASHCIRPRDREREALAA